ncbi:MAG: methionyl-tRNA formyltransferase [Lachnospiraceae bacterium]|jgi:methionyl-tRNA formyltransferase|nr:methionyl-tRNA formyltransferase [Lachnospiraceae bacterium]
MKVIFMGTPDFALPTLKAIYNSNHEVVLAVTQPDRQRGRNKALSPSPVKEEANDLGIPVFQPERIRDAQNLKILKKYKADVIVVVAFGQILPKSVLSLTKYGCINVHASLLPAYRGAAPIQWAILNGENTTGVTTMQMDEGLDTGDILLKREIQIAQTDTAGDLHEKLSIIGAELLIETLAKLEKGGIKPIPQGETTTPYAKMLKKESGLIDWNESAEHIERMIRAFNPWPGAFLRRGGKLIKLTQGIVSEEGDSHGNGETIAQGTIMAVTKEYFDVSTGNGALRILALQPEGKRVMSAAEYLRGYNVKTGERF